MAVFNNPHILQL